MHYLDPEKSEHIWLLHFLFLDMINSDCEEFQDTWNHHPISGAGHDRTPVVSTFYHLTEAAASQLY